MSLPFKDQPTTLHNHLLEALEEQKRLRKTPSDKKRFGATATGFLLTHKKRRLTDISVPIDDDDNDTNKNVDATVLNKEDALDPDMNHYHQMKDKCKQEEAEQQEWARQFHAKVHDLRKVYLYGLSKVSALQDLRVAPDATLPGNVVVQKTTTKTKATK